METLLNCPFCKTEMNKIKKGEVIIDRCPKCLGIWLDKGEMNKIIQRRKKNHPEEFQEKRDWGKPNIGGIPPTHDDIDVLFGEWD